MVRSAVDIDQVVVSYLKYDAEGYEGCRQNGLNADEDFIQYGLSVETECTFGDIQGAET